MDLWDVAGFVGLAAFVGGAFLWHWPAGLMLSGFLVLGVYHQRERNLATRPPDGPRRD